MTIVTSVCLVEAVQIPNADTTVYTSTNMRTILDAPRVTNATAGAVTLTINLVPNGGAVATSNQFVRTKSIAAGATDTLPEIAGQVLNAGDFVSVVASAAASLNFRLSGRQVV